MYFLWVCVGKCKKSASNHSAHRVTFVRSYHQILMPLFIVDSWFYVLVAAFILHQVWNWILFSRASFFKQEVPEGEGKPGLSVVIAAKNEKRNLEILIPKILEQEYPDFEVIIVDDHSWDGTYEYLHEQMPSHNNLHIVSLTDFVQSKPGKKLALTLGIKKAKNDLIVLTDADCVPMSTNWLSEMAAPYQFNETEVVIGYSPYTASSGPLNVIIRFEAFYTMWQYVSFALVGAPYMGVGRNMSYRKSTFLGNKGFAKNLHVPFGDDDLLVQEIATRKNARIVLSPSSHVESYPSQGVGVWLKQKRRHLSAGKHYRSKFKIILGLLWMSKAVSYGASIAYFIWGSLSSLGLALAVLPLVLHWMLVIVFNHKHQVFKLWYLFPVLDVVYQLVLYPLLGLITMLHPKKVNW